MTEHFSFYQESYVGVDPSLSRSWKTESRATGLLFSIRERKSAQKLNMKNYQTNIYKLDTSHLSVLN